MAEKTREEFLAEFAKNIFDETYFSTFTDDNAFFDAAKYLKDNGIPVSELDKQFKKLQQKYVGSRPRAKDNLFDIIGSEYGRSEVKGMRDRFGFDSTKEFNSRTEARKEEKAAEALEEQPAEPAEVAEAVEPQAEAVQAAPKEQVDVDQGPTLENPAGLAAMADNLGARFRDPRIKSIPAIQRRNMEKALNAQALRGIDEDIAKKRREDRTQKIFDDRDADLKEAWARSRTGRRTGLTFDELDADTQADMRNRYNDSREAGAYSDEKYEAYKENTKDPLEKEYERKLKALQESRALPPQDPFIEETKTDAMFTQPRGPESFEMDPAAAASASAFYDNAVKRAASLEGMPPSESGYSSADSKPSPVDTTSKDKFGPRREYTFTDPTRPEKPIASESFELFMPEANPGKSLTSQQPTLDEPVSVPPSQDSLKPKPAYTAENAQQDYDEIKAMRDMEEAKRISQLNSQIQLTNMQKSKAQNIADTKAYHNQTAPTYGKRNDGTYGIMHDPRSPQAMKERSVVMQGINNSKSGDPMQDWMDSRKEEDERKRRQQKFVSQSKASPFYNKSIFG